MRSILPILSGFILVVLIWGCGESGENLPPQIFSIDLPSRIVPPGGEMTITAKAGDADNDQLQFTWSVTGGNIEGSGETVRWKAPNREGIYELTLQVSDGRDTDTKSIKLVVWKERPGDYYPLAIGNTWIYLDENGNKITFKIVDKIKIEGTDEESFVMEKSSSDPNLQGLNTYSYLGKHPDVIYQHAANVAPGSPDTIIFVPWLPLYKLPLIPGNSWSAEFKVKLPEGYYIGEGKAEYEVVDESTLTVPAGIFDHVMQVKESFSWTLMGQILDETISRKWLAPDVGIIKVVEEQTRGGEMIMNTLRLLSYEIVSP
ncbi:TPA: hypothetical protein EYP37_00985 [Candidatus Poribacteria bacterium]|nr:hypothetical protein [Candidatus Poribacteria bacterium]